MLDTPLPLEQALQRLLRVRRRGVQGALQIAGRQASGSGAQAGKAAVQGLHLGVVADHHPILS
ncbi:hypothetical protein OG333_37360 (plasmid) [Streptomyces anulatus]|uniref:hypothetical protein n=1 Tax=Streptomyces TaxID=1883 RepID=UPI000BF00875|nr:hypothetical protein [Streptomyces sp. or20]WSV80087.1 hypothetical protein OG333_37360 [Streptomyces anulatus]